ncbi:sulfotransferase family 2 domain-containing protein [Marimonas lutisalis]|uniref:sulfotransferase family 2 domain-containing protein n=1 Tax=Marimonas lutisalis TaxID=2545756 RepID=UPI0010FA2F54|nr:sulfotransferase family 2 domain-containing protein [Marimonas lutisalis]
MRTVVLHYHLFKNAGTSIDRILQKNFGDKWVTREFAANGGDNSAEVAEWIASTPEAIAYSSHTMLGPVPEVAGVEIIPVLLLRNPIDRIKSAYRFERKQEADTWGAQLAKEHDLEGYVRARLARPGDRQCRNFQTDRLARMCPGDGPELERALGALEFLKTHGVLGRVEAFDDAMQRLSNCLKHRYPDFKWESTRANVTEKSKAHNDAVEFDEELARNNSEDLILWNSLSPEMSR